MIPILNILATFGLFMAGILQTGGLQVICTCISVIVYSVYW